VEEPHSYSRRGGARVGSLEASWPFGRIEIARGRVTVAVMGRRRTLSVAEVLRVEPVGWFTRQGGGPGVRIFFRGAHWEEYVDFYSMSAWREVLAELKQAGFNVPEPPAP
jgi:hypothetical protein